jgi:hypothetical protein
MNEFGKHLRSQCETVTPGDQCGNFRPRGLMIGVFDNFGGDQESGVNPVIHRRCSSISPSKSSSLLNGRMIRPRLTGAMSSTLCGEPL